MATFIASWPTGNATRMAQFFSEDAVYRNGPLEPVLGRDAIVASIAQQMAIGAVTDSSIREQCEVNFLGSLVTRRLFTERSKTVRRTFDPEPTSEPTSSLTGVDRHVPRRPSPPWAATASSAPRRNHSRMTNMG